jgi:hypothetical protein
MVNVSFGDPEAAVVHILGTVTGLVASTDMIGYDEQQTWAVVTRTGGVPTLWMQLDNPIITLDVYAPYKGDALDVAEACRVAVFDAVGTYTGFGLKLYDVSDHEGLTWRADNDAAPHYTLSLALVTAPA